LRLAGQLFFLLSCNTAAWAVRDNKPELITPEQAIQYALDANLDYLNLLDQTELAELDFANARSVFERKFRLFSSSDARSGAEVGTVSSLSVSRQMESGSGVSAELYNASFGDRSLSELRFSYRLPLFQDRAEGSRQRVARAEMSLARRQRLEEIGKQELIDRVIASYLELILYNHRQRLAEAEYELAAGRHEAFLIRARGGEVSEFDLAQMELRMNQAEQGLEMARFRRRSMENAFKLLLGLDVDSPIRIRTDIPANRHAHLLEVSLAELEARALRSRTEVVSKRDEVALAESHFESSSGSAFPPVDITLQYAFVDENNSLAPASATEDHRFGISIRMDTDLGFSARERDRRRQYLELRMARRELEQVRTQVTMDVRRAWFEARQNESQLALKKRARELSEQVVRQVSIQYENGETDALQLLEAEQALERSKYDELDARIGFLQACQSLATASGHYETA
jgi:outer membrane protein TolC